MIIKSGFIAAAPMGDANASIPTPQPVYYRPMFGAHGSASANTSMTFMSQASLDAGVPDKIGMTRMVSACKNTRNIGKDDMIHNSWQPTIEVDAQTYEVRANGELLTCEPATTLPLAQLYCLF